MLHIYRQITALKRVRPVVIAQKREDAERFPFETIDIVAKPATHFLRRFWFQPIAESAVANFQRAKCSATHECWKKTTRGLCTFTLATSPSISCR